MPSWLSSLRDVVADASPLRRVMLALLVLVPLGALAGAYVWFNPPSYRVLYAELSDRAGGEVIAALEQLGISYRLSAVDGRIEVPAGDLHVARYRLAARGLPRSDAAVQEAAERAPSFGLSSLQEQQRQQRALEGELARSIEALEAIELARVHLALPKVSPFLRHAPPATAAVLVRLRPGTALPAEQVATIQTLVAAGVPRMKRGDVQVLDPRGVLLGGAAPEIEPSRRLALEQDLARRALAVLAPWLGQERVSVQVTATLDDSETRQTVERVRSVVVGGQARPLEKTVRTTLEPEGRVRRVNAVVVLNFDAAADQIRRARQLTWQALDLQSSRGDALNVYALPTVATPAAVSQPEVPRVAAPASIPRVQTVEPAPEAATGLLPPWGGAAAAALGVAFAVLAWRRRRTPEAEVPAEDFEVELDAARSRALADPRVTADVIKLWMRA